MSGNNSIRKPLLKRISFNKNWLKNIQNSIPWNYVYCLFAWVLACLLFSKPINLFLSWICGFLFSFDQHSLRIYQWALIGLLVVYLAGRVFWFGRFLWGRFPVLYIGTPVLIWFLFNEFPLVKPENYFEPLPDLENLCFSWLVFGLYLIDLIALTFFCLVKIEPHKNHSSFITDLAIDPEKDEPDQLGFDSFATRIANEIKTVSSSESVVFGIHGEWGEGKTSMINLIRKKLGNENYTVVDFHPWKTSSGVAVTQLFFDVLKQGLKNKIVGINWKIDRYAEALLQLDKTGLGKTIWQLLYKPYSVEKQKDNLRNCMKMLDKNLVVIVDDLDRLAKNEIADVLKIMRDTANFPNLVFLAAYDRHYLNMAIKDQINEHNYENYMNKIVLWEAPIYRPQPRKYIEELRNLLIIKLPKFKENIQEIFNEDNSKSQKAAIYYAQKRNDQHQQLDIIETPFEIHAAIFTNLRTVKKYVNYLVFNHRIVNDSVVFNDFYYLYLLRYFYPRYFDRFVLAYHELHRVRGDFDNIDSEINKYTDFIFRESKNKRDDNQIQIVKAILSNIINGDRSVSSKSLGYYRNFLNYFHLGNHHEITMAEFAAMLKADDLSEYKKKVEDIFKIENIVNQFNDISIISAIQENFYFQNTLSYIEYFKYLIWFSIKYDNRDFYKECHSRLQNICLIPEFGIDVQQIQIGLKDFIIKEEIQKECQYFFYLIVIALRLNNTPPLNKRTFYLSVYDVVDMVKNNFNSYILDKKEITPELINLYYCCHQSISKDGRWIKSDKELALMKDLVLKQPANFIKYIAIRKEQKSDPDKYDYRFVGFLQNIFKDSFNFIEFLKKTDFGEERNRAAIYLKYAEVMLTDKDSLKYPFLPDDNDYKSVFESLDTLDILLDWKLRAQIDKEFNKVKTN